MDHHHHHHHHHQQNNPLVHLADLPNLDYDAAALYQTVPQSGDDLGQNDHAGITTLAEFADMAGSIDQRSRLNELDLDDRTLIERSFGDEAMGMPGPSRGRPQDESDSHPMEDGGAVQGGDVDDGTLGSAPSHLSTTRMVLSPAQFSTDPYMEEFEEHQIPEYLQARAREFVFLKHAEKKNDLKKSKKETGAFEDRRKTRPDHAIPTVH